MKTDLLAGLHDRHNAMIDKTLQSIGNASPEPGLEGRVAIHIADARLKGVQRKALSRDFSLPRIMMAAMSCGLACALIVGGSVRHSRATLPATPGADIRLVSPSGGIGAASAARLATQQVTPSGRPRAVRKPADGRATVAPDAKKRAGETVPQQP
ncbi:hypothetical protein [Silvibacterium acidisoli]|uniref:hypothetical protein n=1 Tax=Acidobacteriaceae bacterium ZG23-2 TaxID=2883246 RepID=UPI00406CF111